MCVTMMLRNVQADIVQIWSNLFRLKDLTYFVNETPMACQIIFEAFLNRDSLRRNDNKVQLLINKYNRLYSQYDALLNIYNKKYCGVLKDLNTQDLTMNYQSVSTVFSVTSASGVTQCLSTAEQKLKKNAVTELTYYNTDLRKYQLTYTYTGWFNIRECILILMIDNLVRLKRHGDPDPGENRSMQLCTLPITIKGVPKDAYEIDTWHDVSCNGQVPMCSCKQDVTPPPKDEIHLTAPVLHRKDDLEMSFASLHLETPKVSQTVPETWDGNNSEKHTTHLELTSDEDEDSCMIFNSLGFKQFKPPLLITKHPPPAMGRDDDIKKLKEVLDDVLMKTDNCTVDAHKIIFAPDHKIAANLLRLQDNNPRYRTFLPEFPVLHLRKSKITILCSAYKDAGILYILKYMGDEEFQEWKKLIFAEMATRYIRRLAVALHMTFFCSHCGCRVEKKQN
ncbi:LOW QUALITY PROTEIN: hypothetical protein MAR_019180 [Mya arenaria]|uniref:Uncharacterized protein n=1 Tax=Mya arenaria TaxID=6604 RepID=A0ABY7EJV3_MYAAR|nr:LOW QUALITY PROTEIN: hypothetical protein MAR_019180 [Mya arenaria]